MIHKPEKPTQPRSTLLKERYIKYVRVDDTKSLYEIYEFKEEIGHGTYGTVISAIEKQTSKEYAIKIVNKSTAGINKLQELYGEIRILRQVDHPNIIHLEEVYESPRKIYMVLERAITNLASLCNKRKSFTEKICKKIFKQLISALYYLHKYDIVHRDVKMENILLTNNPDDPADEYFIKLSDFGFSIVKTGAGINSMLKEYCGTMQYMPPELLLQRAYSELCDIWATGIILYTILIGRHPFPATTEEELIHKICNAELPSEDLAVINSDAADLIRSILQKDPVKRITALEILKHPWIMENKKKYRKDENVLDYMKKWRNEMKVESGEESDWVSTTTDPNESDLSVLDAVISKRNKDSHDLPVNGNISKTHEDTGCKRSSTLFSKVDKL